MRIIACAAFKVNFYAVFEECAKAIRTPNHYILVEGLVYTLVVGVKVFHCFRNGNVYWSRRHWTTLVGRLLLLSLFPKFSTIFRVDFYGGCSKLTATEWILPYVTHDSSGLYQSFLEIVS